MNTMPRTAEQSEAAWRDKSWSLGRRSFLRGAGVAMALPWLEAMSPLAVRADTAGDLAPR